MLSEHCIECGRLLSKNNTDCNFCRCNQTDYRSQRYRDREKPQNLEYHDFDMFCPEQIPGF
ncbi:MAG: hypothetical protein GY874_09640 [Desulfobacteraceae bacterium]|nr:hypothetical protein [Desulfobacteraceae bacterium]